MTSPPPLPLPLHLCHPYVCHTWPACPSPRPLAGVGLRSLTSLALWLQKDQVHTLMGTVFEKPLLDHLNALLGIGLVLPNVVNLHYVTPEVFVHEGYVVISSGLFYQS